MGGAWSATMALVNPTTMGIVNPTTRGSCT